MLHITKSQAAAALRMQMLHREQELKQKNDMFERRYGPFSEFEKSILGKKEDFEKWDNYMEWKAYLNEQSEVEKNLKDLNSNDFEIA